MKQIKINFQIMLCILGILLVGCARKPEKEKTAFDVNKMVENLSKPDAEKVVLLSIKYNVEAFAVEKLLDKYAASFDILHMDVDKIFEEMEKPNAEKIPEYHMMLVKLSDDFGIPKEILASIIIDYGIWTKCEEAATIE